MRGDPFYSKKPIRSMEDFKGLKMRLLGSVGEVATKLGASVMYLPSTEIYLALERGVIDATRYACLSAGYDLGLHEVTEYLVYPGLSPTDVTDFLANIEKWNSLPDDLKAILEEAMLAWKISFGRYLSLEDLKLEKELVDKGTLKVVTIPQEELVKWNKVAYELGKEWAAADALSARAFTIWENYAKLLGVIPSSSK